MHMPTLYEEHLEGRLLTHIYVRHVHVNHTMSVYVVGRDTIDMSSTFKNVFYELEHATIPMVEGSFFVHDMQMLNENLILYHG